MKRTITSAVGLAVATVATAGLMTGSAHGASGPPWEPDASSVGALEFLNSSMTPITTGSTTQPIAAYVAGTTLPQAGDTKATLFGYLPVSGEQPTAWSGEALGASTAFTTAKPVYTSGADDETIAELVADYPNTSSDPDYAGIYQIRLLTSKAGGSISTTYDSADILVSGSTWTVVYDGGSVAPTKAKTTTTLKASKKKVKVGTKLKLTATEKPAVAGTVTFRDGKKAIDKKVTVKHGKAAFTTKKLKQGKHKLTATFTPAKSANATGSTSKIVKVKVVKG